MTTNKATNVYMQTALRQLRFLLNKEEKLKWLAIACFAAVTSVFEVITASVIVVFVQVLNQPALGVTYAGKLGILAEASAARILLYLALAVGAVYLVKNLVAALEVFFQNFTIHSMSYRFKQRLLQRYAHMDYGVYLTRNSSFGMQVVSGDAEQIFSVGMLSMATICSEGMIFLSLLAMMVYMNPALAGFVLIFGGVITAVVFKWLLPRFYHFGQKMQEASIYTGQHLTQFFHAFKEIVLLGQKDFFIHIYQQYAKKKAKIQALQTALNVVPRIVIEVLFVGLLVATIVFLCIKHSSPAAIIGILGGYVYAGFRLMPGLNRIINQLNSFKAIIPAIERVYQECTTAVANEHYVDVASFAFQQSIVLDHVSFQYLNTHKDVLQNIALTIHKGECLGIIGETGSGKSTLIDLLLGLLRPHTGSITVDGSYPVYAYQWHKIVGYVPQSIYLTDDTIAANIAFGQHQIDMPRLEAAIAAAQLSKFVAALPAGVNTLVGERGVRLSGGERQRIAIARALYRNPEVLIFDEATSALDNETEARLMETIRSVSQHRTVIMVAHRLTTLKDCQRIVVMQSGKISNIMSYQDLESHSVVKSA
jgi:ABC-type multidrug transport system fused ATPase/permease subunit